MTAHHIHCREITHKVWVLLSLFTKEIDTRPLVRHPFIHGDNGIEQDAKVRAYIKGCMCRYNRCQMSACREAHDAHIVRIDAPYSSRVANDADASLHIADGFATVAPWQTIVDNEIRDALIIEPIRCQIALMAV